MRIVKTESEVKVLTAWKCPKCNYFNKLESGTKCGNTKSCSFDIENGDYDPEFAELTETDFT